MTAINFKRDEKFSGNQGMSSVWTKVGDGARSAGTAVWDKANVETLRLAITGLSGAGKTVFLVSVISNLFAMVRGPGGMRWDSLPRLREKLTNPHGQSRLSGIEIEPTGVGLIPRFPYAESRDVSGDARAELIHSRFNFSTS
jgi:predicted YcjX-like family ATPase